MTHPIQRTRPVGSVYNDADAVAAVEARREAQPPVIVSTPLVIVDDNLVTYASMTTSSLAGGIYSVPVSVLVSGTNQGTTVRIRLFIDTVDVFGIGPLFTFGSAGAFIPFSAVFPLVLAPGVHTIEVKLGHPASAGTASGEFASIIMERYL